jgi:hypothetical protein
MPALVAKVGSGLGKYEDYFGVTAWTGNGTTFKLETVSAKKTPRALKVATATDENDNFVGQAKYGTDTIYEVENSYDLVAGTLKLNDGGVLNAASNAMKTNGTPANTLCFLGPVAAGAEGVAPVYGCVIESVEWSTGNGQWPRLTVRGIMKTTAAISLLVTNSYQFSAMDWDLTGTKTAQAPWLTIGAGAKITGSSYGITGRLEYHEETGVVLAIALTGATHKATVDGVEITAAPAFTAVSPFAAGDIIQSPGRDVNATSFATASAEAQLDLGADTAS